MPKIKICGLSRMEDINVVNKWKPDYIGFVFAKSPRQVTAEQANSLKKKMNPDIKAVGVFVNEKIHEIVEIVGDGTIDMVQLHGDETEYYINELQTFVNCPIIKAVQVQSSEDVIRAQGMPSDFLLLDSYHKEQHGGNGITFDHSLIPQIKKPYFIAGGLNINNISYLIKNNQFYGVDISSGVETNGMKDEVKIKEIIQLIRNS